MLRVLLFIFLLFNVNLLSASSILDKIKNTGEINVGLRDNLYPFSYLDKNNNFDGFVVDFAKILSKKLSQHLNKNIKLNFVKITTQNRFDKVMKNDVDIEMGSTSYSYEREKKVDFSIIYFFSETTLLVNSSKVKKLNNLNNKVIGVTKNTTNEKFLLKFLKENKLKPKKIVYTTEHSDSIKLFLNNDIDAFCSDRAILWGIKKTLKSQNFNILNSPIGYEPYAFMIPENNSDFRDFINNFIVWLVKSQKYFEIYNKWFGSIPISPFLNTYLSVISYDLPEDW